LIVGRESCAFARLRDAIRSGLVIRRYQALVAGSLRSKKILDSPIAHHPRNRSKMVVVGEEGRTVHGARPAMTVVEPIERLGEFTLVSIVPRTGSRHQIRVHLASAGHPLAGDELYGGAPMTEFEPGRLWLHLREVEFDSPVSGRVRVEAPLPSDLASAVGNLRAQR
jgi:23S rRNA-/tRNA-specific pseudouridylate synthase